jgi:hypothetical protein
MKILCFSMLLVPNIYVLQKTKITTNTTLSFHNCQRPIVYLISSLLSTTRKISTHSFLSIQQHFWISKFNRVCMFVKWILVLFQTLFLTRGSSQKKTRIKFGLSCTKPERKWSTKISTLEIMYGFSISNLGPFSKWTMNRTRELILSSIASVKTNLCRIFSWICDGK